MWIGRYDGANRLLVAAEMPVNAAAEPVCSAPSLQSGGWCHQYAYDRYGNRRIGSRVNDSGSATEPNLFSETTNRIAATGWTTNERGEMVREPDAFSGARSYGYDAEGRLVATCADGATPCSREWTSSKKVY